MGITTQPWGVAYGKGVDSTAILVGLHNEGLRPDFIIHADVGSEKAATYAYTPIIDAWLEKVGFPPITNVRYEPKKAPYTSMEGNMTMNCTLPPPAFNAMHSCTMKWKIVPQKRWHEQDRECVMAWARGEPIVKLIGYDASEGKRVNKNGRKETEPNKYSNHYPLIHWWGWDREECKARIAEAGLIVPVKSSCFFCPNIKENEVRLLTPEERGSIIRMEVYAEPFNLKTAGLWRKRTMTQWIIDEGLEWEWPKDDMPVNPNCKHERLGYSCNPPHVEGSLREMLKEKCGFIVPPRTVGWEALTDWSHDQMLMEI